MVFSCFVFCVCVVLSTRTKGVTPGLKLVNEKLFQDCSSVSSSLLHVPNVGRQSWFFFNLSVGHIDGRRLQFVMMLQLLVLELKAERYIEQGTRKAKAVEQCDNPNSNRRDS